ncbi:glycosyltransferase [Subtercola boreus]|uniref:Glycosyltransferase n=1 Tax=Subtercola boreus TaxID=120213 RepID=A0A3E0VXM1_9MICO|nr:glycosyltransferase [Subtercola boreus]
MPPDATPLGDAAPLDGAAPLRDFPPLVDVVLPCLNEADALPWVLGRLPAGYRAIVVDNGSTDDSAAVARAHGAIVVTESRRGFGAAAHAGLLAATAETVAFCDADASMDPSELPRMVALLAPAVREVTPGTVTPGTATLTGARLVLGRRRPTSRGSWPLHARLANRALSLLIRLRSGVVLHDLGPMRVARRADLLALGLIDRRSGYPLEMVLRTNERGWSIVETDTAYSPRVGRSKVTGTVQGTIGAIRDMSRLLSAVKNSAVQNGAVKTSAAMNTASKNGDDG